MTDYAPPAEGVTTPPDDDFEMYLQGNEDGDVEIICDHPRCLRKGRRTPHNPNGLWLQDVGHLPYRPTPAQVVAAWDRHRWEKHTGGDA